MPMAAWCSLRMKRVLAAAHVLLPAPYDARYPHPDGYVDKCTFCLENRVQKGLNPACVSVCPT